MKRIDWAGWLIAAILVPGILGLVVVALDGSFGCHFPMFEVRQA